MSSSIKYLRPQSTVMLSDAGMNRERAAIAIGTTNDVLLGLTVSYSDGSGEELIGIQLSDEQLEQLKQNIISFQKTRDCSKCQESQDLTNPGDRPTEPTVPPLSTESNSVFSIDPESIDFRYKNHLLEARTNTSNLDGTCRLEAVGRGLDENTAKLALNRNIQRLIDGLQIRRNTKDKSPLSSFTPFVPSNLILELNPKLVVIKHLEDIVEASISFGALGTIQPKRLVVVSRTENEARLELNKQFQELVYSVVVKHG